MSGFSETVYTKQMSNRFVANVLTGFRTGPGNEATSLYSVTCTCSVCVAAMYVLL